MSRPSMSLPHERRKAQLKAQVLRSRVRIAEERERMTSAQTELKAMKPKASASTNRI